ncbi:MAG: hypothetical protein FWG30_12000 [Eubacteriaceae bacterium]|nr:hypothetical protein [Eubacteriaceae bacterium]
MGDEKTPKNSQVENDIKKAHIECKAACSAGDEAFERDARECAKAAYMKRMEEISEYALKYRPIMSREDELWHEGFYIGYQKGLENGMRAAIREQFSDEILRRMAYRSGICLERLNELISEEMLSKLSTAKDAD